MVSQDDNMVACGLDGIQTRSVGLMELGVEEQLSLTLKMKN